MAIPLRPIPYDELSVVNDDRGWHPSRLLGPADIDGLVSCGYTSQHYVLARSHQLPRGLQGDARGPLRVTG